MRSYVVLSALLWPVRAEELLFRLRGDMAQFYAELRHQTWRLALERLEPFTPSPGPTEASAWSSWLRECADAVCSCNDLPEVYEICACPLLPFSTGQLGRTLRLGRVLWCVAAAGNVNAAADFYAHTGGSAALIAHGMAVTPGRTARALLWTWEAQRDWAAAAARNLQAAGADSVLVTPPAWEGPAAQQALLNEARSGDPHAAVRAVVVAEAPAFPHAMDRGDGQAHGLLLQAPCLDGGIQFLFIDPLEAFVPEFSALFQSCPGLKWIAVHNTNLQDMAGWIPRFLANRTGWRRVLRGSHVWRPVDLGIRRVPRRREWQLWARHDALQRGPPELSDLLRAAEATWGRDQKRPRNRGGEGEASKRLWAAIFRHGLSAPQFQLRKFADKAARAVEAVVNEPLKGDATPSETARLMEEGDKKAPPVLVQASQPLLSTSGNKETQKIIDEITKGEDFETNRLRCLDHPEQAYYSLSAFAHLEIEMIEARNLIPSVTSSFEAYV
ncbi:unnamed protein product, partial [Effrenium voratum]